MGMILRIASSRIVGQGDIVGRSGYFSLNLSANSVMRGRLDARRTLKSLVADLRLYRLVRTDTANFGCERTHRKKLYPLHAGTGHYHQRPVQPKLFYDWFNLIRQPYVYR